MCQRSHRPPLTQLPRTPEPPWAGEGPFPIASPTWTSWQSASHDSSGPVRQPLLAPGGAPLAPGGPPVAGTAAAHGGPPQPPGPRRRLLRPAGPLDPAERPLAGTAVVWRAGLRPQHRRPVADGPELEAIYLALGGGAAGAVGGPGLTAAQRLAGPAAAAPAAGGWPAHHGPAGADAPVAELRPPGHPGHAPAGGGAGRHRRPGELRSRGGRPWPGAISFAASWCAAN